MEDVDIVKPQFKQIAQGLAGAEGPVFTKDGKFYMVAPEVEEDNKPAGQIVSVDLSTGQVCVLVAPSVDGYGGIPAGCQADKQGNLYVADMRLGILKVSPDDATFKQLARVDADGEEMQGCNDCSMDYEGNLWITAPAAGIAPAEYRRSFEAPFGSVYCLLKGGDIVKVATGFLFCNGIAVQHTTEGKPNVLIVAETGTKTLWAFDIVAAGKVTNKRVWASIPGDHEGGPDGMDFDAAGNLLVANWGSQHIEVFGPEGGKLISRIQCPFTRVSNLHFKPDTNEVYVTEHDKGGLWSFSWREKGRIEYCQL